MASSESPSEPVLKTVQPTGRQPIKKRFRSTVAGLACLSCLLGLLTGGCTRMYHTRRSIQELDQTFMVNKHQTLFYADKRKNKQSKRLTKPASAALYLQNDTLFVELVKTSLPANDGRPETVDVSDSTFVFFVNPRLGKPSVDEKSIWFRYHFTSFDADLITIPFKYRIGQQGQPPEMITTPNAAVYIGLRYDQGFQRNVFYHHQQRSEIRSYSIGAGGLVGLTAATIRSFSTAGQFTDEYEGVCLSYGLAAIFGYRAVNLGLALGFDYLVDQNKTLWIYQNKPWLGVTIGLNLN